MAGLVRAFRDCAREGKYLNALVERLTAMLDSRLHHPYITFLEQEFRIFAIPVNHGSSRLTAGYYPGFIMIVKMFLDMVLGPEVKRFRSLIDRHCWPPFITAQLYPQPFL
jgi:hypothetical protein